MMTARENYLALCNGEKPERLVNQYEPFEFVLRDPLLYDFYFGCYIEGQDTLNPFGVTIRWKKGEHAGMPYVTEKTKVIQDVTEWKKYIKMPGLEHTEEEWAAAKEDLAKIDRKEKLATGLMVSGIFETAHSLMGFEDTLMNFLLEPEAMNGLFDYLFEFNMRNSCLTIWSLTSYCHMMTGEERTDFSSARMCLTNFLNPDMKNCMDILHPVEYRLYITRIAGVKALPRTWWIFMLPRGREFCRAIIFRNFRKNLTVS